MQLSKQPSPAGTYERLYQDEACVWGLRADGFLAKFIDSAPKGLALDLGCGEGRHTLYLAQEGFRVLAIDLAPTGIKKLRALAHRYGFSSRIGAAVADIRHLRLPPSTFTLVLSTITLVFMTREEIVAIIDSVKQAVIPGGCVYITGFTADDPDYLGRLAEGQQLRGVRTLWNPWLRCYQYWFDHGELRDMFIGWEVLGYEESVITWDRPPYKHAVCLLFARRPRASERTL